MREAVLSGIDGLLDKQQQQMRGEEAAALRQLRCRLAEVEALLRQERQQQNKGQVDLQAKTVRCRAYCLAGVERMAATGQRCMLAASMCRVVLLRGRHLQHLVQGSCSSVDALGEQELAAAGAGGG